MKTEVEMYKDPDEIRCEFLSDIVHLLWKFQPRLGGSYQLWLILAAVTEEKILYLWFELDPKELPELIIYSDNLFEFLKDKYDPRLTGFRIMLVNEAYSKQKKSLV